jgi:hypothetical protein
LTLIELNVPGFPYWRTFCCSNKVAT